MFISSKYGTIETLLNRLYALFEYDSALFTDDLGYKWYVLKTVLGVLGISDDEYINGVYLMEINDTTFISEEGINVLLLEYDNEYQDDLRDMITSDVMPDIKSNSMYMSDHLIENMRTMAIKSMSFLDDMPEAEFKSASNLQKYCDKKANRRKKQICKTRRK